MSHSTRHNLALAVFAATAWIGASDAAFAQDVATRNFGTRVVNIATVTYTVEGETTQISTPEAVFVIRPPETPAVIEFFRYAPTAADPIIRAVNGSDYSPSGDLAGPFSPTGAPVTTGGDVLDLSSPIPLIPASTYLAGELMFVRVTDAGQNMDSTAIETVEITIVASNGDQIVLRLYESGPDSGEFYAYLPSTPTQTPPNDNVISAGGNTQLTATYVDVFDSTDVTVDTAILNPLNRVFSSVTSDPVDGAVVTLVNTDTGAEATVFGVDGFSTFPSDVISGTDVRDSSGLTYSSDDGEFRYPLVEPGNYIIRVDPPEGYTFASSMTPDELSADAQNAYVLTGASYGQPFTITETGPLRFDIPLDPESNLVVSKVADRTVGDVGDYINYTVTIRNQGVVTAPARLYDTLPLGFRYVPGTSRIARLASDDPTISDGATELTFDMGMIDPGDEIVLDYALLIGPGAVLGQAVNEAVIRDGSFDPISNVARAAIELREDLLRSTSTIVGRMTENSCDGDADWARPINRGDGVEGVRLYMETGAYAVSDFDGLYHFEGVSEGTHVVQVDEETLPQGYSLMTCEENTRYAGAVNSKFIDVQGGGIWRANFYLERTGEIAKKVDVEFFNDATEYKKFDTDWLEAQDATATLAYPDAARTATKAVTNIGIKHAADQTVELLINDRSPEVYYAQGTDRNAANTVAISRWRNLDLQDGRNVITANILSADGTVVSTLREDIWYVKTISRAVPMPDRSTLIADGRTPPVVAIRMEDQSGRPVHAGRVATIDLEPPYRLFDESGNDRLREQSTELLAPLSARQDFNVGQDGILEVKLEPTLRTGKVTVIATLDNGRKVPIYMYLEPEKRDWILVGLAEGTIGLDNVKGNSIAIHSTGGDDDVMTDGRVAFFAKGLVKGEWLMTLAVDTDKGRTERDAGFGFEIDPNAYYSLYGDRSYQEFEGVSRYPVYVKLEKRQAYAMFGDFDTNVTEGRLTAYSRRMSGLKAEYLGDDFQVLGYAAETNQGFAKDEIAAEGLSGPYQLTNDRILAQSEEITVETRDRLRPDIILERRVLVRYLDYTLDYFTGELIFRLPVDASDADFNPNVIVVDYETAEGTERNITAGGRVQAQFMDDKLQVGSTFTHEEGNVAGANMKGDQIGVDVIAQLSDTTQLRAEWAMTETSDENGSTTADAKLLEIIHNSEKLSGEAYFREQESGFGLGQLNSNTADARRYGVRGSVKMSQSDDEETGRRTVRRMEAQAAREENLSTGETRDTVEVTAVQDGSKLDITGGLRFAHDDLVGRENRRSMLAIAKAAYDIPKHGARIQIGLEQPLDKNDEVSAHPQRLSLGLDKSVGDIATINFRHDILSGAETESINTTVGVSASPWSGANLTVASDRLINDSGRRLGATVGLDQTVAIDENWSASGGLRVRKVLDAEQAFVEVLPDAAISPFELNDDFTSAYIGAAYRNDVMSGSARIETRETTKDATWVGSMSVARELTETLSLAGAVRGRITDPVFDENESSQLDVRLGGAWRPRDEDTIIFDRLDIKHRNDPTGVSSVKIVNNAALNTMVSDRWQLSTNWGVKHVKTDLGGQDLSSTTHLFGAETRFDVTERIDVGLRGSVMTTGDANGKSYAWGPSIGISPAKNVWVSAGYNVEGYRDEDFEASEYARKGIYLQMRFKFDQDSAEGLLRRISPQDRRVGE